MNNSISVSVTAVILDAAAKYGSGLLSTSARADGDDMLRTARNLVLRFQIDEAHGAAVVAAVGDVVERGEASGRTDVLRDAVAAAIGHNPDLASDLAIMMSGSVD